MVLHQPKPKQFPNTTKYYIDDLITMDSILNVEQKLTNWHTDKVFILDAFFLMTDLIFKIILLLSVD